MITRRQALFTASAQLAWASLPFAALPSTALAAPTPLPTPVTLKIGVAKVAHLAPMLTLPADLAPLGVTVDYAEFVRFADSRTAMASGSLDIAVMAAGDLPLLLSQGVTSVVGLMGVGSSKKHPIVRAGVKCDTWQDLMQLKLGVPPGSAVWYQFVGKLQELGFRYDQFKPVNIQGAGQNFVQALQRGDVDAFINAEPTESMPEIGGFGAPATKVDYSDSRAAGAELGLMTASKSAMATKSEAVKRFLWAYGTAEKRLAADQAAYASAIQQWCGLDAPISTLIAGKIKLGGVVDSDQLVRLASFLKMVGIIQKDVASDVPANFDAGFVRSAMAG
jgi:sulfonate transport system substrate-binding protein